MSSVKKIIDCKGLNCPLPVINTKKYFDGIEEGTAIVIVDNEIAKTNIEKFATSSKYEVHSNTNKELLYEITITKGNIKDNTEIFSEKNEKLLDKEPLTVLISSDKLGEGSEELGTALMKSYLFALSEAEIIPENLIFINGGVKLVTKDSLVLESLEKLKTRGTNIQSCGLCLDYYKIKDELAIGTITNMYAIVELMNSSKLIKL